MLPSLDHRTKHRQNDTVPDTRKRAPRRTDALSSERIVAAAIELLDEGGESTLTVRALTSHLSTGRGAIYHHVGGMDELLALAADSVIEQVVDEALTKTDAASALRSLALGLFDAVSRRPWVGAQLSRDPRQPALFRLWKSIGVQLQRLGLSGQARTDAGGALLNYILGSAAQYSMGALRAPNSAARQAYLDQLAAAWSEQDADPVVTDAVADLRAHQDRDQFLAGVDIFLRGIADH
jgi:AcrR family transcriptional regulator